MKISVHSLAYILEECRARSESRTRREEQSFKVAIPNFVEPRWIPTSKSAPDTVAYREVIVHNYYGEWVIELPDIFVQNSEQFNTNEQHKE